MKLMLASLGAVDTLFLEGWRIPRDQVQPLRDAATALEAINLRIASRQLAMENEQASAREAGFQKGVEEGLAAARTQAADEVARLFATAAEREAELEAALGRLVLGVIRRFCGQLDQEELLGKMAAEAFRQLANDRPFAVRVRPEALESLAPLAHSNPPLRLIPDSSVPAGECIFETSSGTARTSLSVQLLKLEAAFDRCTSRADAQ